MPSEFNPNLVKAVDFRHRVGLRKHRIRLHLILKHIYSNIAAERMNKALCFLGNNIKFKNNMSIIPL